MGEIIARPNPPVPMPFTGERLTSEYRGQTEIEHLHRYLFAREWCRGKDVLDVASGEGYGTALLAQIARTAIGVEIAQDAVEHATSSYVRENLSFLQGDARSLPVPDASRDVVISFETIEHFAEQQQFVDEVRRVLRPGGLFVVSTPDRDNYSPAESTVNPYHVKEMTGTEFEALLRLNFANLSVALQRPMFGSVLLPAQACAEAALCFERRGSNYFEASSGLARPQYFIAFASDGPAPALPPSVYVESGRLGLLSPEESAAALDAAQAAMTEVKREADAQSQRAAAAAQAAMTEIKREADAQAQRAAEESAAAQAAMTEVKREADAQSQRAAALAADLVACQAELAAARGEAQGLITANVMTERACATYQAELATARGETRDLVSAYTAMQSEVALIRQAVVAKEADLVSLRMSHSWRVTAPLRQISRMLYRRP